MCDDSVVDGHRPIGETGLETSRISAIPKPVLSLDGGGGRGFWTAIVLAELERLLGRPLHEVFDLVIGTSTGAILGLLIASGRFEMPRIVSMYRDFLGEVFPPSRWRRPRYLAQSIPEVFGLHLASPLYSAEPLEKLLRDYLSVGGRLLTMVEAQTNVAATAWDSEGESAILFTSYADHKDVPMWEVARSSSAAQTYFAPHCFRGSFDDMALSDGGGGENNPARTAIAEAISLGFHDPLLVSIGTGRSRRVESAEKLSKLGYIGWAPRLLRFTMGASADWADHTCNRVLPRGRYFRLQSNIPFGVSEAMDDASARNIDAIATWAATYVRRNGRRFEDIVDAIQADHATI